MFALLFLLVFWFLFVLCSKSLGFYTDLGGKTLKFLQTPIPNPILNPKSAKHLLRLITML